MIPRVSVTAIEQWRLWRHGDWMAESDLIASIRGEFHPNRKMLCGMAFHAILEAPDQAHQGCGPLESWYEHEGIRFPAAIIDEALSHYERGGIPEVKTTKVYRVNGEDVEVVAKVDVLRGLDVLETKTRWSTVDFDHYSDGCQWRFYADIYEALRVRYVVFQMDENAFGQFSLRGVHKFTMYPYPGLSQDCVRLLSEFMEYVHLRGLEKFLVQRGAPA